MKNNIHILGNYELGWYVYKEGIAEPLYKVSLVDTGDDESYDLYTIEGKYQGNYYTINRIESELNLYLNN